MNLLLITLDQFRGDCLSSAGHPLVETPNLDRLARSGVRLARHYSQANPCAPGRACLYTGTYLMNNRVVGNGTPLDDRLDNVARLGRRAGYVPALFGYTDQAIDPRRADGPDDPRLRTYEGVLPGFDPVLELSGDAAAWVTWLRELGHDVPDDGEAALQGEPGRPAEHSISAFLTDRAVEWIRRQERPWFAHLSYWRPHPPYAAAGHWSRRYDPAEVGLPIEPRPQHPMHELVLANRIGLVDAPTDEAELRHLRAQYLGMVGEVDDQLGRLWAALEELGQWDDTFVVLTADHGEMLGDHGLVQKLLWFEESHHVVGIVRDPRHPEAHGRVVERFTENVDLLPTIAEALDVEVPDQADGLPLTPFLRAEDPPWWREAAHWEFDWRTYLLGRDGPAWPWDRRLERVALAVLRTDDAAYVQFADGTWRCWDLGVDPTWRTLTEDPDRVLPLAQAMLTWRLEHAERTLTNLALTPIGPLGRGPLPEG